MLFLFQGCAHTETATKPQASEEEHETEHHVRLSTMKVRESLVPQTIDFPGKVAALPDHSVLVRPNIAGMITKVFVVPGQKVHKGQLIALLDDRQIKSQLEQAQAPQKAAATAVEQAKIALELAQNNLKRTESLFQKDIVAEKDIVAMRSQAELAKSQVEAAQAKLIESKLAPSAIATQLSFTKVYSPISGVVAQRFLNVGSAVDPATPIIHIIDLNQVMIIANMPADSAATPDVGHTAVIFPIAEPNSKYKGVIKSVSPVVDATNNTVGIELLANNSGGKLKESQQVTVSITISSVKAILIPETAIVPSHENPDDQFVYVVNDGKLKLTKIETGQERHNQVAVLHGLKDRDEMVTSGGYGVPDGAILDRGSDRGNSP